MLDFDKNTDCSLCSDKCIAQFIDMEDIPILNRNKTVVHYSAGQVITKQSSFSSKIIYISSGLVKTMKEGRNGKNTIIQVIGENSFLTIPIHESQKKYTITSIALTDAKICEINEPGIHEIISKSQKFSDYILDSYFEDQIYLTNRLHILNTRNNHGKLASSLLYLNDFNKNGFSIFEHLTRKDLAELSSISLESVNKILQELKNDKIIDINNKGIQINKHDLIDRLSNIG